MLDAHSRVAMLPETWMFFSLNRLGCAERFEQCLREAGVPAGVFQAVHMSHADTERTIGDARVDFVAFTGSVAGGHAVQRAASERFIGTGLELGGCDPVYVRHDADLAHAIENVVDGAYFNSGQSCCGLQRIYVHDRVYDAFVEVRPIADQLVGSREPDNGRSVHVPLSE